MDGESTFGHPGTLEAVASGPHSVAWAQKHGWTGTTGGFSQATPDLFRFIRETVASHHFEFVRRVQVVPSSLSGAGPLIGAAALVHLAR
jgi:glucokinase